MNVIVIEEQRLVFWTFLRDICWHMSWILDESGLTLRDVSVERTWTSPPVSCECLHHVCSWCTEAESACRAHRLTAYISTLYAGYYSANMALILTLGQIHLPKVEKLSRRDAAARQHFLALWFAAACVRLHWFARWTWNLSPLEVLQRSDEWEGVWTLCFILVSILENCARFHFKYCWSRSSSPAEIKKFVYFEQLIRS